MTKRLRAGPADAGCTGPSTGAIAVPLPHFHLRPGRGTGVRPLAPLSVDSGASGHRAGVVTTAARGGRDARRGRLSPWE
jgi:hypothetical protein